MVKQIRIYLTLKKEVRQNLERWAESQGRPLTNFASWLVERSIKEAIDSGELKPSERESDSLDRMRQFFDDVAEGRFYPDKDLAKLAIELDISVDHLIAHQDCFKKKGEKVAN